MIFSGRTVDVSSLSPATLFSAVDNQLGTEGMVYTMAENFVFVRSKILRQNSFKIYLSFFSVGGFSVILVPPQLASRHGMNREEEKIGRRGEDFSEVQETDTMMDGT